MDRPSLKIDWSRRALRDLARFAAFLLETAPELAPSIAVKIIDAAELVGERPLIGRPIRGTAYRQFVLRVSNAPYVLQYEVHDEHLVVLRVFHGREKRDG